jgi:PTS system fructose-specific IIA component
MDISSITSKDIIFMNLKAESREDAIRLIIDGMGKSGMIEDKDKYFNAVSEREKKGTTAIGYGVAIPHGKSDGVVKPFISFARLEKPLEWASFDGQPVRSVFMIGVPSANAGNDHLKILIAISKKLMHEDFRKALDSAKTPDDVINVLKAVET